MLSRKVCQRLTLTGRVCEWENVAEKSLCVRQYYQKVCERDTLPKKICEHYNVIEESLQKKFVSLVTLSKSLWVEQRCREKFAEKFVCMTMLSKVC